MSRRRALRRPRRVQVNFWKQGEPTSYIGYTTNISMTGMFIATNSPMPSGVRVRIEIVDRDRGFMVEGVVAHARKIRGELARISQSGMGVRFLSVEELVRELIPAVFGQTEEIPRDPDRGSVAPSESSSGEPEPPMEHAAPRPPTPTPVAPSEPKPPEPFPPAAAAPFTMEKPAVAPVTASGGSFSVSFSSTDEFMEVYRRDILQGGLFVSTLYPARLQETVLVELHPPIPTAEALTVRARVVQRFEPSSDPYASPNLLSGMGLELLDLPLLVEKLQPVMRLLRG
jgi:Tfp pilus assembly protein PilZ